MRSLIAILLSAVWCLSAFASVQDYQIIRLISMDSDCSFEELKRVKNKDGSLWFFASCRNLSHYPDGIKIYCPDATNERTCMIKTQSKEFNNLKMLQENEDKQ